MTTQSTLDLVCLVVANSYSTGHVQLDEDQQLRVRAQVMSSQAMDFYTGLPLEIGRSNGPYKFTVERLRPGLLYDDTKQMCVPSALFLNRLFSSKPLEQRARYVQSLRRPADWNSGPQRLLAMVDITQEAEELSQEDVDHWRPIFFNQRKDQVKCRWDLQDLLAFVMDMGNRCAVAGVKTKNLSVDRFYNTNKYQQGDVVLMDLPLNLAKMPCPCFISRVAFNATFPNLTTSNEVEQTLAGLRYLQGSLLTF